MIKTTKKTNAGLAREVAARRKQLVTLQDSDAESKRFQNALSKSEREHRLVTDNLLAVRAELAELRNTEARLRRTLEELTDFVEHGPLSLHWVGVDGTILWANQEELDTLGYRREEYIGHHTTEFHADRAVIDDILQRLAVKETLRNYQARLWHKDGSIRHVLISSNVLWRDGEFIHTRCFTRDITKRKRAEEEKVRLEEELRASHKLEAVGQLAGGIAHDFNNLLTVITGYSQLLLARLGQDDPSRHEIEQIDQAGARAAGLTQKLLAFGRKQVLSPKVLDLNGVVTNMDTLLQRLIGEDITLVTSPDPALWCVKADPGQLEQVLMNLAVNARDAMPEGGKITIETQNVELDATYASAHDPVLPGSYVMLAVSDTGCGMDAGTQTHMFEPFFTTKEPGKGTGLGLAMVYGVVKQSGGYVWLYSEPGIGTTVKIFLPRVTEELDRAPSDPRPAETLRGSETILLVEDEGMVRNFVQTVLHTHGYTVLAAWDGGEALRLSQEHTGPIALLLTDMVMPGMNGRETADRLVATRPETRVLYMSGYTDIAIVQHRMRDPGTAFLQKPLTPDALARKVREVLDGGRSRSTVTER